MLLRVIDIETTGLAPPSEIIEIGRVDIRWDGSRWDIEPPLSKLYRCERGIPPDAMAVHHITEVDLESASNICNPDEIISALFNAQRPDILVAHNAGFEASFIPADITGSVPWLCTFKSALRLWPDAPKHTNQTLRYWRGLKMDAAHAMPPHRAGPDAWVTAHLLVEMLRFIPVQDLVQWTTEPKYLRGMPFGKHRSEPWSQTPTDYLGWVVRQQDMDADVRWWAQNELDRRSGS